MMFFRKQFFWVVLCAALTLTPALSRPASGESGARPGLANGRLVRAAFDDRDDHRRRERDRDRDDNRWRRDRNDRRDGDGDRDDWNRNRAYRYPNYGYSRAPRSYGNSPYGYNDPNYGYSYENNYNLGYRDGFNIGRRDYASGFGFDPRRYSRAGDTYYRAGFDAGYRDAFTRRW